MSETTKHTPGPWTICCEGRCPVLGIGTADHAIGRFVPTHDGIEDAPFSTWTERDRANARVAAAGADLLAACKALVDAVNNDCGLHDAMAAAESAIAKADPK